MSSRHPIVNSKSILKGSFYARASKQVSSFLERFLSSAIRSWRAVVRRVGIQGVVLKEVASTVSTRMINSIRIQSLVSLPSETRNKSRSKQEHMHSKLHILPPRPSRAFLLPTGGGAKHGAEDEPGRDSPGRDSTGRYGATGRKQSLNLGGTRPRCTASQGCFVCVFLSSPRVPSADYEL